ncbi:MAG: hypothetical protein FD177_541 [Desulfovibrionaceae bacterium]|nr:MAG: hypothetical protein FD177_541 [Desulfovibrionaceae bacterium]
MDYKLLLEKLLTAKGIVFLVALGFVAFFVYKNFDFVTEVTFKVDRGNVKDVKEGKKETEERRSTPVLEVENVQMPSVSTKSPSYMFVELSNSSAVDAMNVNVILYLGRSTLHSFEIISPAKYNVDKDSGLSVLSVSIDCIKAKSKSYIYLLINGQAFDKIVLNADGMSVPKEYGYSDFSKGSLFVSDAMISFFRFLFGVVVFVFTVAFVGYVLHLCSVVHKRFFKE